MNRMLDPKSLEEVADETADWEQNEVAAFLRKQAERRQQFYTISPERKLKHPAVVAITESARGTLLA